jgi:hypothetical protein
LQLPWTICSWHNNIWIIYGMAMQFI